ncbi:unnamed protein product [Rotaria socialis]|uniref:BTB domain-containing protein n=1 Tax=Rotaria socialis TaxID=392032 RepID=A0A820HZV6_9BILA|nr:unnamed protein product [Rotaria socialis]CAF4300726.1 unnamed protein product [Rotaria socialis]CAF4432512.1 unnamed protein product [Rotaria socialis]CAF4497239.1 unnamed protein product [Rotaria socialis]
MSSNLTSDINKNDSWTQIFDRFNQNIRAEADTLLKHISDSRTNLINERDSLQSEIELLKKEKDEMTRLLKKYDQIVTLNVGGQLFSTTIETLTKEKCLFTKMFSGQYDLREHQGATFIDRDPTHFRTLLNYLRTNTFIKPKSSEDYNELCLEAEYYQITTLINQLRTETVVIKNSLSRRLGSRLGASRDATNLCMLKGTSWYYYFCLGMNYRKHSSSILGCYASMGVATSLWETNKRLGDDSFSWTLRLCDQQTYDEHAGLRHDSRSLPYHNLFPKGTRVGALLDLNQGTLEFVVDGVKKGIAFTNLKGHTVTPIFEFCHATSYRMNHNATVPTN